MTSPKKPASARKTVKAVGAEETATRYQPAAVASGDAETPRAAEALPSVLEQSTSENPSATATLEN